MKKDKLLILFSKWPTKQSSKSRISGVIGEEKIEEFCFACLDDLIRKIKYLEGIDLVIVPNTLLESALFNQRYSVNSISLESMGIGLDSSKSEMFKGIFNYFLERYNKVSLIPMDIPHIDIRRIEESFEKLSYSSQVFGPEINGGVYLMGLRSGHDAVFNEVRWSTEHSFNDLMKNSENPDRLGLFFDLNTVGDFVCLNEARLASCPALTRFIKSLSQNTIIMKREVITI